MTYAAHAFVGVERRRGATVRHDARDILIESGSHTPGVSAAEFGLPPFTALRYEQPDAALRPYFTDYHVLDSAGPAARTNVSWMLPSWPAIRITLADRPTAVRLGSRRIDPMPVAALYGPTSRTMEITSSGGVTIGAGITPLGWSRLFGVPASSLCDRIVPLDAVMAPALVASLVARLTATFDRGRGVKPTLDRFLRETIGPRSASEDEIRGLMDMLLEDGAWTTPGMARELGLTPSRLRRLADRHFGFPPTTLRLRARFLRSLLRMMSVGDGADYSLISPNYYDASHFLRDADRFLGMTPRRFLALPTPYLRAVIRARAVVLGRGTPVLDTAVR